MREVQMMHQLGDREVLEMGLLNGAQALGQAGKLGQISPGSIADLVAFPFPEDTSQDGADAYARVVHSRSAPNLFMVNGRRPEVQEAAAKK
jgi:cytosine/adenosine deaminase-related metal-dependent hydrolase